MNKALATIIAMLLPTTVVADGVMPKAMVSYINYAEPTVMMEHGVALGVGVEAIVKQFQASIGYKRALTHYQSENTGELTNTNMQIGEVEFEYHFDNNLYTGIAYVLIDNDKEGMKSNTGHDGYQRTNHQVFATIGYDVGDLEVQLNALLHGWHQSFVGDASDGQYENTAHDQWFGVGVGFKWNATKWLSLFTKGTYIHKSTAEWNGEGYWHEPNNFTTEVGISFGGK